MIVSQLMFITNCIKISLHYNSWMAELKYYLVSFSWLMKPSSVLTNIYLISSGAEELYDYVGIIIYCWWDFSK